MSVQYSGGPYVNYPFTDAGTRLDLVNNLNAQLKEAGWSVISGDESADVLMKSAVTPAGLSVRLRLYDPGGGNCAQLFIKNNAGTLTSQAFYLLPESVGWRIVANPYWFGMFKSGAAYRNVGRSALFAGTIWVPDSVATVMGSDLDCGFIQGVGSSDGDTGTSQSWRNRIAMADSMRASTLFRSFMLTGAYDNSGQPMLISPGPNCYQQGDSPFEWEGGGRHDIEALIAWSPDGSTGTRAKIKGQLWDAMAMGGLFDGETTISFDGHTFIAVTDQCSQERNGIGTLFVAIG